MKVNGQLDVAQLENLSADPALLPRARIWFDKVLGKARLFDGSTTQSLAFETAAVSTAPYDAGLASISKTITWSNGVIQRCRITTGCVFSFVGGTDGQEYTLIIDSNTSSPAAYAFALGPQDGMKNPIIPLCLNYGEVRVHKFIYRSGFPTAVVTTTLASDLSPTAVSNGATTARCLDLHELRNSDSVNLVVGTTGATAQANVYPFRRFYGKAEWYASGAVTSTGADNTGLRFSPSKSFVAVVGTASPYLSIFKTYTLGGTPTALPTAYSNPGTLPTGAGAACDWHPTERTVAIAHTTTPFVSAYPWSAAGFGTKWSNPATLPTGNGLCCAFNSVGDYLAVTHSTTPFISVYAFDLILGFGAKSADPSVLPATQTVASARSVAWSPAGDWIVMGTGTTPYVWACPFNRSLGTFGVPQANTAVNIPAGEVRCVAFSKDGAYIFIGATGSAAIFPFTSASGIDWANPLSTSFAAVTYIDAVWSNYAPMLFTIDLTVGKPIAHSLGYYQRPWVRSLDC